MQLVYALIAETSIAESKPIADLNHIILQLSEYSWSSQLIYILKKVLYGIIIQIVFNQIVFNPTSPL